MSSTRIFKQKAVPSEENTRKLLENTKPFSSCDASLPQPSLSRGRKGLGEIPQSVSSRKLTSRPRKAQGIFAAQHFLSLNIGRLGRRTQTMSLFLSTGTKNAFLRPKSRAHGSCLYSCRRADSQLFRKNNENL